MTTYTDLTIRLNGSPDKMGIYPVEATLSDGSHYSGGQFRLDMTTLLSLTTPESYGQYLFESLFSPPIQRGYDKAQALAEAQTESRLRIHLHIDPAAAELQTIRWERLYQRLNGQLLPLSISAFTPFSRYISLEKADALPLTEEPLTILVSLANPDNLPLSLTPINIINEVANLYAAFNPPNQTAVSLQVRLMAGRSGLSPEWTAKLKAVGWQIIEGATTLDNLMQQLTHCHLWHFIGHGSFRQRGGEDGEAVLHLEDANGQWIVMRDVEITTRLAALKQQPHLAFLVACQSSQRGWQEHGAPFVGLGPKLVQAGIPAVIAMQDLMPMNTARDLAHYFYQALRSHGLVDSALNEARQFIFKDSTAWDVPVLFMRSRTGQLLAPDPIGYTLKAMLDHPYYNFFAPENARYLPLPIEVTMQRGEENSQNLANTRLQITASLDLMKAIDTIFQPAHNATTSEVLQQLQQLPPKPKLVILMGSFGSNKSLQLRRIGWETINASLALKKQGNKNGLIIPIYIDLANYGSVRNSLDNPIKILAWQYLQPFWPNLTLPWLEKFIHSRQDLKLRVLFANVDTLSERDALLVWQYILMLMSDYPRHEYIMTLNPIFYNPKRYRNDDIDLYLLLIQPLAHNQVQYFLENQAQYESPDDPSQAPSCHLLEKIYDNQLFDLAATPRFLVRMIHRTAMQHYPNSRTEFLQHLVEDALAEIPVEEGMRLHAETFIYRLAWQMHSNFQTTWPIETAFQTMSELRGYREYNLEIFLNALVEAELLTRWGDHELHFAYLPIQAYCCAKALIDLPDHERKLDNIIATFGRLTRLRWWTEVIIIVTGLLANESTRQQKLLNNLIYAVDLLQSEQSFLATFCLLELRHEQARLMITPSKTTKTDPIDTLTLQVVNALFGRLTNLAEPRLLHRNAAAHLLGQLAPLTMLPRLVAVAHKPPRENGRSLYNYDYINIRMATAIAIRRMFMQYQAAEINPYLEDDLQQLLTFWRQKKVAELIQLLQKRSGIFIQSVVVLALGDLQPQLVAIMQAQAYHRQSAASTDSTHLAEIVINLLITFFFNPKTAEMTLWAVTQALALLDTIRVTSEVLHYFFIHQAELEERFQHDAIRLYRCLAFLIGRIRSQEPLAREFLLTCLQTKDDVELWAAVIEALGWLADSHDVTLLEEIALGHQLPKATDSRATYYLRRKAIEALSYIGSYKTLNKLRDEVNGLPELREAFYSTSEEIHWRLSQES